MITGLSPLGTTGFGGSITLVPYTAIPVTAGAAVLGKMGFGGRSINPVTYTAIPITGGEVVLGTVGFGGDSTIPAEPEDVGAVIRHTPVAVVVAVLGTSPEASFTSLPSAVVAVAAHNAEMNTGSLATPNAAPVIVETGRLGQGSGVVAPTVILSVTVGASVSSVLSVIPPANVSVGAASCAHFLQGQPSAVAVVGSGAAPTQRNATLLEATNVAVGAAATSNEARSTATQVNVVVAAQPVVHSLTSAPATSNVAVAGQVSSTGLAQTPAKTTVGVMARNAVLSSANVAGAAGVSVSGVAPTQGVVVGTAAVQIVVTGAVSSNGTTLTLPGKVITVQAASPATGVLSAPQPAAVVVAAGVLSAGAVSKPSVAPVWVRANARMTVGDITQNFVVVLNANTLAASEYSIPAVDVVEYDNEVYYIQGDGIIRLSESGDEVFTSEVQTGQVDFGQTIGKRCPFVSLITGTDTTPEVYLIDDTLVEYPTAIKQGHTDKYTRTYNSPRGVLTTRLGFKIRGPNLDFTLIDPEIVVSANR